MRDAVKGGACETGRTSRYRALTGRNGVRGLSVAVSGGFAVADGGKRAASVPPAAVVCGAQCYRHSSLHCLVHHVCLLQHQHRSWRSEKGSAPACPTRRQLSFVSPGSGHADVDHDCNELLPLPKLGTAAEVGAGWLGTETEPDVYLFQVSHQLLPSQLAAGQ